MPLVIPEGFINLSFGYQAEGDPELAYTSIGLEHEPGISEGTIGAVAQAAWDAWMLRMKTVTATQWRLTGAFFQFGNTSPPYVRVDLGGSENGSGATQSLPNNCAALVKKSTLTAGRQGRGRMYVPGLVLNAAEVNGVLNSTERGLWQDALNEWIADLAETPNFLNLVVFHEDAGPILTPSQVTTLIVDTKIATQRRRMR